MYIDPNTGGVLFQLLAVGLACGVPLCGAVVIGGVIFYFVKKQKS